MSIEYKQRSFHLKSDYKPAGQQPEAISALVENLRNGMDGQTLLGVTGSGKTFTMANVIQQLQRTTLVMAPNKTLAAQLYGEMSLYFPDNAVRYFVSYYDYYQPEAYLPTSDTYIEKDAAINVYVEQMRLSATKALLERSDTIIVATVSAIYGLGDPDYYKDMTLRLVCGEKLDQRAVFRHLAQLQYTRNDIELHSGNYRVYGDIIEIYPAESDDKAIKIHLFDDEIERITYFDPLTKKRLSDIPQVTIFPKTHYATPREKILQAIDKIKKELKERLNVFAENNQLLEKQRLEDRTRFDLEMMLELGYCAGIENYSRHLSERQAGEPPPTLFSYLPQNSLLFVDESHVTIPQIRAMYYGDRSRKENLVAYGFRLPSALDNRPLIFEEFERLSPQSVYVSATPGAYEEERGGSVIELLVRPTGLLDPEIEVRSADTQVDDLLSEIMRCVKRQERVLVTTLTKKMAEDLTAYFFNQSVRVRYLHSDINTVERVEIIRDLRLGVFDVLVGINLLREGLDLPEVSLVAILDADKQGFLRSKRSLMQTIGRAARNIEGKAILYANKITVAMQYTISETNRRRKIQVQFNETYHITPQSIRKSVRNIMLDKSSAYKKIQHNDQINELLKPYQHMGPEEVSKALGALESKMYQHAEQLEFKEAAKLRDQIKQVRDAFLQGNL